MMQEISMRRFSIQLIMIFPLPTAKLCYRKS